jgi:hypothetical protein
MRFGIGTPASPFPNPVIQALGTKTPAGSRQRHEEGIGLDVVEHMKGAIAGVLGAFDKGIRARARELR